MLCYRLSLLLFIVGVLIMYIFFDDDEQSLTRGTYCIRDGSVSYDGFTNLVEAIIEMQKMQLEKGVDYV